jgi:hypothetical protein
MKKITKILAFATIIILTIFNFALAGLVPDTGQTKCYDNLLWWKLHNGCGCWNFHSFLHTQWSLGGFNFRCSDPGGRCDRLKYCDDT